MKQRIFGKIENKIYMWWQPYVFIVSGMPHNGKSTFSINFAKSISNTAVFHVDTIFEKMLEHFPDELEIKNRFDIYAYVNHNSFNKELFLTIFEHDIKMFLVEKVKINFLILEGYVCDMMKNEIIDVLKKVYNFNNFYSLNAILNEIGYNISIDNTDTCTAQGTDYTNIIKKIFKYLNKTKNINSRTTYQNFPWILNKNSNSEEKFLKSIKNCNFVGKSFIDFGCNSGWFCFRAKELGALTTVGVDCNEMWIELANDINNIVYNYGNMSWYCKNIFEYSADSIYDIIFCASTFHYFADKQKDFIDLIYKITNTESEIYLKVEISPNDFVDVDWVARNADSQPLAYPSMEGFKKMIFGKFVIESITESAFQPGSIYKRYFFKLKRTPND